MKQSLELKLGQRLTLTPQLQQAIKLLQLSAFDLRLEVQEALEKNPLLEELDGPDQDDPIENPLENAPINEHDGFMEQDHDETNEWHEPRQITTARSVSEPLGYDIDQRNSAPLSLKDHLREQIRLVPLTSKDLDIATALIDAINDDGYLTLPLEDIQQCLEDHHDLEIEEIEAVLHCIQSFDPVGVGSRDLRECLLLQLKQQEITTPAKDLARQIINRHLEALGARDFPLLQKATRASEKMLREAINVIQNLHPRPGASIPSTDNNFIVPDVIVNFSNGDWRVELNSNAVPRLTINQDYKQISKNSSSPDQEYIQNHFQEARWFVKSINNRNETLLKVAKEIIKRQREFLEKGEQAMKPMILNDISQALDLHESTISRATTNKYMLTPRGVFELKYFFSSSLTTSDGGITSATAIQSQIRKLIGEEPQAKPYSDSKITQLLTQQGINVARRTVAKYREGMNIPPSNQRKTL